jgi:hypothetical protein
MHEVEFEKHQREEARWRILRDIGRPNPVAETLIWRHLTDDLHLQITPHGLRRELDYLDERKLIKISGKEHPIWLSELTREGIDVIEYTIPCEAGIARPQKYWAT